MYKLAKPPRPKAGGSLNLAFILRAYVKPSKSEHWFLQVFRPEGIRKKNPEPAFPTRKVTELSYLLTNLVSFLKHNGRQYFPTSLELGKSHAAEFWPMWCEWKCHIFFVGQTVTGSSPFNRHCGYVFKISVSQFWM